MKVSVLIIGTILIVTLIRTDAMATDGERISQTAVITLHRTAKEVFPLFGAIEEKKWADGWNPEIVFSASGGMEEDMIFKTKPHIADEPDYLWVVSRYDPVNMVVGYMVSTDQRVWTITIGCRDSGNGSTVATVTYTFTGLSEKGNKRNAHVLKAMFANQLKDWERAINYFLETGKRMKHGA